MKMLVKQMCMHNRIHEVLVRVVQHNCLWNASVPWHHHCYGHPHAALSFQLLVFRISARSSRHFGRNGNRSILQCFHLNDNTKAVPHNQRGHDRLHKVKPIIERLRETWRSCYHPPYEQSINEEMVGFEGRSAMKQHEVNQTWLQGAVSVLA